jgi:hypothetical protein
MPWVSVVITLTNLPMCGRWKVSRKLAPSEGLSGTWYEILPMNSTATALALMSPTGTMWVQAKDMSRAPAQIEELF